jgi:hypothetical protein
MRNVIVISYIAPNSFSLKCLKYKATLRRGIPPLRVAWKIKLAFKVKL